MSRMSMTLSVATLALLQCCTGWAVAARKPTSAEKATIIRTVKDSKGQIAIPRDQIAVTGIRISTFKTPGRLYARVRVHDTAISHPDVATGVVRRLRGHWRLIDLGTAEVGCHNVPKAVRDDLRLPTCV